jgi:multicomponent Na+:H+ antiporter subunit E
MKHLSLFILTLVFWLLLTLEFTLANLAVGAVGAAITAVLFGKYFFERTGKFIQLQRYFWFVIYLAVLIWECIKANLDVAYRVLHPRMPIKPGIVKVRLQLKSEFARAMLSNSITMTPGTIAVDIIGDDLYVHWIYVTTDDPEAYTRQVAGRFEKYIKKTFE